MKFSFPPSIVGSVVSLALATSAFAQVSNFDSLNGYAAGLEARVAGNREALFRAPAVTNLAGLTVGGQYTDREIDAARDRIERDTQASSVSLGYGWKVSEWVVGVGVAFDSSSSDYTEVNSPAPTPLHGAVESDTWSAQLWTGGNLGAIAVQAALGFGQGEHDGSRVSDIGSSTASFDSDDVFFRLQFSYDHAVSEGVLLQPFAGFSYIKADADGFTEVGTAPDRRIVGDFSARETMGNLGVRLAGRQGRWVPSATVAWLREFSANETTLGISAINNTPIGSGVVPNTGKSFFFASVRLDGRLQDGWTIGTEVNHLSGGDEKQWGLQLAITKSF